jgi:hypothetical protein
MGSSALQQEITTAPESDTLAYEDADGVARLRTLISALGPPFANREALIGAMARKVEASGRRPVICASELDLYFIVNGALAVEILPRHADLPTLLATEYAAYLKARWVTLLAKWQIDEEVTLGQTFETFLAAELAQCAQAW